MISMEKQKSSENLLEKSDLDKEVMSKVMKVRKRVWRNDYPKLIESLVGRSVVGRIRSKSVRKRSHTYNRIPKT